MGNRIRELRRAKNLTMKELGRELGVAESTISQYETGKRQPDNETLLRLGEFFDVTVGYLLGAETEKAPAPEGEREISNDDLKFALWGDVTDITDDDLDDVRRYAEFIKERKKQGHE